MVRGPARGEGARLRAWPLLLQRQGRALRGLPGRRRDQDRDALFALEQHLERLAVVAFALADVAGDVDVGQKVHLDLDHAVALAGFAAPALDVEGEAAGLVAARLRLRQAREPFADRGEFAGIGRRIAARRAADRRLVDVDHLVEMLEALDAVVRGRGLGGAVEL